MIRFESPIFLLLLLLPLFWQLRRRSRRQAALPFASVVPPAVIREMAAQTSWRVRYARPIVKSLATLSFAAAVVALARPQAGSRFLETEAKGRDISLVLDISGSMQALDFQLGGEQVDRLTALKDVVSDFIAQRAGDRIGLIVFGDQVFTQSPMTQDRKAVTELVQALEVGMAGKGTAIGDALAIAIKRVRAIEGESKVIILVTDGKSNSGTVQPIEAAKIAQKLGIKVYTIGIGGEGLAPFPVMDVFGRKFVERRPMEFDEKTLRVIAETTAARYYNAKDTDSLKAIYQEIDSLEERAERSYEFVEYEERFLPLLLAAIVLMVVTELSVQLVFSPYP